MNAKPLENPKNLNAFQAYKQVCHVAASTSRGSNPDWHKAAHEVHLQWHIRITGSPRLRSAVFSARDSRWTDGPKLNLPNLRSRDAIEAAVDDLLSTQPGAKSLGVVLHIADEFATTEIFENFHDWDRLGELNQQLITNPNSLIGEDSAVAEETSWRVIPTPGAITPPICTTVAISHRYGEFLEILRAIGVSRDFPILTAGISAPLAFLSVLPAFLDFSVEEPRLVVLHYLKFSALAIFNASGELMKLRALPHRGRPHPPNLSDALTTAIAANELVDPRIVLIPMTTTEIEPLVTQLHATLDQEHEPMIDIIKPGIEAATHCEETRSEMLVAQTEYRGVEISNSFRMLSQEGWAMQDFLSEPASVTEARPTWKDLQLLKITKLIKPVLALAAIGVLTYSLFGAISARSEISYAHDEKATARLQAELGMLGKVKATYDHWNGLLSNRSTGWTTLELIARLFPADSGVILSSVDYTAASDPSSKKNTAEFTRKWTISGSASDRALVLLQKLNTRTGIEEIFSNFFLETGIDSFDPSPESRSLLVNISQSENSQFKPTAPVQKPLAEENCPYRFSITITQRFTEDDSLAITENKQP